MNSEMIGALQQPKAAMTSDRREVDPLLVLRKGPSAMTQEWWNTTPYQCSHKGGDWDLPQPCGEVWGTIRGRAEGSAEVYS